jgi:hypothetical protein
MTWNIIRTILSILGGIIAGYLCVAALEFTSVYFFPVGFDPTDELALKKAVEEGRIPLINLVLVQLAWISGAFVASFTAGKLAHYGAMFAAWLAGGFILFAVIAMLFSLPHPLWLAISSLFAVPVASWLGWSLTGKTGTLYQHSAEKM